MAASLSVRPIVWPGAPLGAQIARMTMRPQREWNWLPRSGVTGAGPAHAVVEAASIETEYLRAGAGTHVVLLGAGHGALGPQGLLFAALAERFRVIAPISINPPLAEGIQPFSAWLRAFLDGLGIVRASLVADQTFSVRALRFAAADGFRVNRLVLLFDAPEDAPTESTFPTRLRGTEHPLLVRHTPATHRGDGMIRVAREVLMFLEGDGGPHAPEPPAAD